MTLIDVNLPVNAKLFFNFLSFASGDFEVLNNIPTFYEYVIK